MLSNLPSILSGVLVVVAVAAAAWGALNRETLKTVRESNKDLLERVAILEGADKRNETDIARLTSENVVLRSVVTGEATLIAIAGQVGDVQHSLNDHHLAAEGWIKSLDTHVVQLINAIHELKEIPK